MKVTISIECSSPTEVTAVQTALASILNKGEAAPAKETKTTKKTDTKKEESAPTPEPEAAVDLGFDDAPAATEPAKALTLEDVVEGFKGYAQKNGRENAGKVLGKFGVKSVRDLKPDSYEKVMKALA